MKKIVLILLIIIISGSAALHAQETEQEKKDDNPIKLLIGLKYSWKDYEVQEKLKDDYRKYGVDINVFVPLVYKSIYYIDFSFRTDFNYLFIPANELRAEMDGLSTEEAYMFELGLNFKGFKFYLAPGLYQLYSMEWSVENISFMYLFGVLGQVGMKFSYGYFISSMSAEYRQLWGVKEGGDLSGTNLESNSLRMVKHKHLDATVTAGCVFDKISIEPGFSVRSRDIKETKSSGWSGWDDFDEMEYIFLFRVGIVF